MASSRSRTWTEGLENLGENLIRLASALRSLEEGLASPISETSPGASIAQLAAGYARAFRMAQPVLLTGEEAFLVLVPSEFPALSYGSDHESHPEQAHTLVHEAILGAQEIVNLMDRMSGVESSNPDGTLQVLRPALPAFAESSSSVGWELKAVCHEYRSEVSLAGGAPQSLTDLGPGVVGLVADLARAARHLRTARREWYRLEQSLSALATASSASRRPAGAG